MTSPAIQRLFSGPLCLFLATSAYAGPPYWLPEAQGLAPRTSSLSSVQLGSIAPHPAKPIWRTLRSQQTSERWSDEASALIVKYRLNPLRSIRALSYLHVAMDDAGLRAEELGLKEAAQTAAVHVAASHMLAHFFPLESASRLEAIGESALVALTASQPQQAHEVAIGASVGRDVARLAMLRALNDGADVIWDARTRPAEKPGMWHGTPPLETAHPQEPLAGSWQTWIIKSGGEIQPPAPPDSNSDVFLRAAQEVLDVSTHLTPEQRRIAEYWHLDQGTVTPPGLWNLKARELAARWGLTEKERLRLLSLLNVAMLDASIACWHAKYSWWVQRPATTIQERLDKTFMPYLVTPPHPSYVSGHATVSGAAAEILKRFFPKSTHQIDEWAEEAAQSRLYGGIHYRFDNEAGLVLGRQIGKTVLERAPGKAQSDASTGFNGHPATDAL